MSIQLHSTLGVNPRLTYCPRCGKDGQELILLGSHNYYDICECGLRVYGGIDRKKGCPKCGQQSVSRTTLLDSEKIPGSVCQECIDFDTQLRNLASEQNAIGVVCEKCHSQFIVKGDSEYTRGVRSTHPELDHKPVMFQVPCCHDCEKAHDATTAE